MLVSPLRASEMSHPAPKSPMVFMWLCDWSTAAVHDTLLFVAEVQPFRPQLYAVAGLS